LFALSLLLTVALTVVDLLVPELLDQLVQEEHEDAEEVPVEHHAVHRHGAGPEKED